MARGRAARLLNLHECSHRLPNKRALLCKKEPPSFPIFSDGMEVKYFGKCGVSCVPCQDREPFVGRAVFGDHLEAVGHGKVDHDVVEGRDTLALQAAIPCGEENELPLLV